MLWKKQGPQTCKARCRMSTNNYSSIHQNYEAVIGIEVHVQLKTKSKIFCADSTEFNAGDNENVSPISLGMPGTLPVLNKAVIDMAIKTGLALNCQIPQVSVFARKNYFYPDLPKGYQISQYDKPICEKGYLEFSLNGIIKKIGITRAHLEEDAGKSTHFADQTLLNYNRAGVPLLEIVSEPELRSAQEAAEYCKALRSIVLYLDVCDGNLEEGSMRCDCNVSVRKKGESKLGTRVEIKNLNSFRFIEKALDFEIERQIDQIESGNKIVQETRLYDPDKNRTFTMRIKEDAQDYRYFSDPDLLPIVIHSNQVEKIRKNMPELPLAKINRYVSELGLTKSEAIHLVSDKDVALYFEKTCQYINSPKLISNWIQVELLRDINERKTSIWSSKLTPETLASLIQKIEDKTISGKIAKLIFNEICETGKAVQEIINMRGYKKVDDSQALEKIIDEVLSQNIDQLNEYRGGKHKVYAFFVGQIMKETKGQADPDILNEILKRKLDSK